MITDLARFIFAMLLQSFKYSDRFQYFTLRPVSTKETIIKESRLYYCIARMMIDIIEFNIPASKDEYCVTY